MVLPRSVGGEERHEVAEGLNWTVGGMMKLAARLSWDLLAGSLMRRVADMVHPESPACTHCGVVELWERNLLAFEPKAFSSSNSRLTNMISHTTTARASRRSTKLSSSMFNDLP